MSTGVRMELVREDVGTYMEKGIIDPIVADACVLKKTDKVKLMGFDAYHTLSLQSFTLLRSKRGVRPKGTGRLRKLNYFSVFFLDGPTLAVCRVISSGFDCTSPSSCSSYEGITSSQSPSSAESPSSDITDIAYYASVSRKGIGLG